MDIRSWAALGSYYLYKGKHQIFYRDSKKGEEVILLLHGFPTSSWDWSKIWPALSENYRLITLDFIGYGLSDKPFGFHYSTATQANLAKDLLEKLNIHRYHILSHDYGDTVTQEMMASHEDTSKLLSVCMLNGGIIQGGYNPRLIQKLLASRGGLLLSPFLNKAMLSRNFNRIFGPESKATKEEIDTFYTLMIRKGGRYILPKTIQYINERKAFADRWKSALLNYKGPLQFINGNYDPVSGIQMSEQVKKEVPNMNVIDLKHIGHYPQVEAPDLIAEYYLSFLNGN